MSYNIVCFLAGFVFWWGGGGGAGGVYTGGGDRTGTKICFLHPEHADQSYGTIRVPLKGPFFCSGSGPLARGTPPFFCGRKVSCRFKYRAFIRYRMVSCATSITTPLQHFLPVRHYRGTGATGPNLVQVRKEVHHNILTRYHHNTLPTDGAMIYL